jgi:hypothetical protein
MKRLVSAAPGPILVLLLASSALATPGARDLSFDDDGRATVDFGTTYEGGEAVAIGTDGSILIVGGIDQGGPDAALAMARLTSSGEPDLTFSDDGSRVASDGEIGPLVGEGSRVATHDDLPVRLDRHTLSPVILAPEVGATEPIAAEVRVEPSASPEAGDSEIDPSPPAGAARPTTTIAPSDWTATSDARSMTPSLVMSLQVQLFSSFGAPRLRKNRLPCGGHLCEVS